MHRLLFVARVTFICNLFFGLCLLVRHTHFTVPAAAMEFVIITGWVLSVILNVLFAVLIAVLVLRKRPMLVPLWLTGCNLFAFAFQIVYRIISAL